MRWLRWLQYRDFLGEPNKPTEQQANEELVAALRKELVKYKTSSPIKHVEELAREYALTWVVMECESGLIQTSEGAAWRINELMPEMRNSAQVLLADAIGGQRLKPDDRQL